MRNIKPDLIAHHQKLIRNMSDPRAPSLLMAKGKAGDLQEAKGKIQAYLAQMKHIVSLLEGSKTIVFPSDLLLSLSQNQKGNLAEELPLPFNQTLLQFSKPLLFSDKYNIGEETLQGLLISVSEPYTGENTYDPDMNDNADEFSRRMATNKPGDWFVSVIGFPADTETTSRLVLQKYNSDEGFIGVRVYPPPKNDNQLGILYAKNLVYMAGVCCQYIDQENVVLEASQLVPEKVNRKREKQGKRVIEPYYICRIKKVQPAETHATGEGTEHGFRYDVRSHDRHYKNGTVVRVKAHQRGLKHDHYVPKTYLVKKERE